MMNKNKLVKICAALLSGIMLVGFVGCAAGQKEVIIDIQELVGTEFDMVPLGDVPQPVSAAMPAEGTKKLENAKASIDVSHTDDGYIMIKYLEKTDAKLKVIIVCPSGAKYTYNLNHSGTYEVFPLSDGNGTYKINVCKNIVDSQYAVSFSATIENVALKDEYAPFRLPNQYVNYKPDSKVVAKAKELCAGCTSDLERIGKVYDFVIHTFQYNDELAATVTSGYLPDVDKVLEAQKGICFDYAAVMTAMLRSQGIPCKLVVGYAGDVYHAWINAYSASEGWLNSVIFFDGQNWKLMDPTFASTGGESKEVMDYIVNGTAYNAMYLY